MMRSLCFRNFSFIDTILYYLETTYKNDFDGCRFRKRALSLSTPFVSPFDQSVEMDLELVTLVVLAF